MTQNPFKALELPGQIKGRLSWLTKGYARCHCHAGVAFDEVSTASKDSDEEKPGPRAPLPSLARRQTVFRVIKEKVRKALNMKPETQTHILSADPSTQNPYKTPSDPRPKGRIELDWNYIVLLWNPAIKESLNPKPESLNPKP